MKNWLNGAIDSLIQLGYSYNGYNLTRNEIVKRKKNLFWLFSVDKHYMQQRYTNVDWQQFLIVCLFYSVSGFDEEVHKYSRNAHNKRSLSDKTTEFQFTSLQEKNKIQWKNCVYTKSGRLHILYVMQSLSMNSEYYWNLHQTTSPVVHVIIYSNTFAIER